MELVSVIARETKLAKALEPVREKYDGLIEGGLLPVRRWGEPGDVAKAVLGIVKGYHPYSTGEVINVDGGFHIRRL